MNASGNGKTLLALDTSRVRVNPRLLSPCRQQRSRSIPSKVGGAATREETEESEKEIQKLPMKMLTQFTTLKQKPGDS